MEYNKDKVDEMALALLYLTSFNEGYGTRAWKSIAWEVTDRLFKKGYIDDPKGKAKSVALTEEGEKLSKELFIKHFGLKD